MQLKVGAKTDAITLAKSIAGYIHTEEKPLSTISVGAGASNQALKAIAIARGYVASAGVELRVAPRFKTIKIDGNDISAIVLDIEY